KLALLFVLLLPTCLAKPFHQQGLFDFMLEDEGSADMPPTDDPVISGFGPVCPFRCQCHLRVVQCSDLGLEKVPKDLPPDTTLLDLQNNKITEIKEGDFKNLKNLHALILVNNKISKISPSAFAPLKKLERLYLSKNNLKELPENMPKSLQEIRAHENEISKLRKAVFNGLNQVIVLELGTNPIKSSGIENGAFQGMKRLSYIRIADTNITSIPKGLPPSLTELHLDGNKISKIDAESLSGLTNLAK
ncbi:PGS2 protein, partial [Turnix velox]|nr:PGS2 protein [Turnix velox]